MPWVNTQVLSAPELKYKVALIIELAEWIEHAQISLFGRVSIVGSCDRRSGWPVCRRELVSGYEPAILESVSHGDGLGVGGGICADGSVCMDGMGLHAWSGYDSLGLVGSTTTAEHLLVVDIFWFGAYRLVTRCDGPVGNCCPGDSQDVPAYKTGSIQPDDAGGRVVDVFLAVEFFSMASQWRWFRLDLLIHLRLNHLRNSSRSLQAKSMLSSNRGVAWLISSAGR